MPFKISLVGERFSFESLAVAKITNYPFEKRDFKPFAQARICISGKKRLFVRMWAFECKPVADITQPAPEMVSEDSILCFQLGNEQKYLSVSANANGVLYPELVSENGKTPLDPSLFEQSSFTGEDLQGEYWGMQFSCDIDMLDSILGIDILQAPLKGNIYKACFNKRSEHIGALFDAKKNTVYNTDCFGDFIITNY